MLPQRISDVWASQISVGGWEPVNAAAAVEMIKNQLEDVKKFSYENGWSKDWPPTVDEERSMLLKEIKLLLVLFCDRNILSCSIRDRVMDFVAKKLEDSKDSLTDSRLLETPQGICLLECHELNQILAFLRRVKCERDDGTDVVRRAVDSFCNVTKVDHETALSDVRKLCSSEDDRRKNLKTDEWKNYKSVLCDTCEEGDAAKTFSDAVGDVLNKSSELESENLSDDDVLVLESIKILKSEVNNKVIGNWKSVLVLMA
ncbi:hypothetical protein ISN45_Aa01g021290 [Arabidopsis thaliana x Arabidopsis arenosa]|uniref:DUF629 domain-containing protein n=1 Tax=Arabidopsis thaliana x Arabidopsis arenosa TaxID=1240361 RepID=A0A8T2C897_9BRAS|nr:hypothetical protein ISN45_Aa01g021290 [Arabidopsis thaliana x Arabidopsis arenosa]